MDTDTATRLHAEHAELKERVAKLAAFITSDGFYVLPRPERRDLDEQLRHMRAYLTVLSRRVGRNTTPHVQ